MISFFFFSVVVSPSFLYADMEGGADVEEDGLGRSDGVPQGVRLPCLF